MRLIDADALLEAIGNTWEYANPMSIIDLITNAPNIQREGWVSVEDGLPDRNTRVLICDSGNVEFGYISDFDEWYGENYEYDGCHGIAENVTHWQLLPPAPTETE